MVAGGSINGTARHMGISRGTIQKWVAESHLTEHRTAAIQQKKEEIGQKVYELLEDYIETLRIQVRVTRDEAWIKRQSAGELAVLHGVYNDKAIRLLAAFRPHDEGDDAE